MVDTVAPPVRSRIMAAVKGRDTTPEIAVRRASHAAGYRFRLHRRDLPGRPDLTFARHRIAVFVHGCFWHSHHCRRGQRPSSNVEFWNVKLTRNVERDQAARLALEAAGWRVVIIWECGLGAGIADLIACLSVAPGSPAR